MSDTNQESISNLVRTYIDSRPSVQESLSLGIVNYSSLSRLICKEMGFNNTEAAIAACRRFQKQFAKRKNRDKEITSILDNGRLLVRTHLIMALCERPETYDPILNLQNIVRERKGKINIIDGEESVAVILGREFRSCVTKALGRRIIEIYDDLVQLSFIFPRKAITTPGVAARLYSVLSGAGINVFGELTSCGDHLVVIHEKDLIKALSLIQPKVA